MVIIFTLLFIIILYLCPLHFWEHGWWLEVKYNISNSKIISFSVNMKYESYFRNMIHLLNIFLGKGINSLTNFVIKDLKSPLCLFCFHHTVSNVCFFFPLNLLLHWKHYLSKATTLCPVPLLSVFLVVNSLMYQHTFSVDLHFAWVLLAVSFQLILKFQQIPFLSFMHKFFVCFYFVLQNAFPVWEILG